jgi:cyclopropane-fatty-acyl-phospholipid synthase
MGSVDIEPAGPTGSAPPPADGEAELLTAATVGPATRGYPFAVRQALKFATALQRGSLAIEMPDGRRLLIQGEKPGVDAQMRVNDLRFATRLFGGGDLGIAESNLRGEWESSDLTDFLRLFAENFDIMTRVIDSNPLARWAQLFQHWLNRNTKRGSQRNIHSHYDIGNAFYSCWLDETMTYSSAIFEKGDNDLSSAQVRKYRTLASETGIGPQDHVLEIGCGWGGFAEYAAGQIGCRVTGLTISEEQFRFATERMARAGLADRVTIKLQDYRDERGTYDRIASIEMFEAVGEKYWPVYFRQLHDRLRPGGTAGVQVITIAEDRFVDYRRSVDFIQRYIFPGGMLPSPTVLREIGDRFGLSLTGDRAFGLDYAATLVQWRERFRAAWPKLTSLGFDERFRRLWEYYLAYCEAGFRSGAIDVHQIVYAKPA